MNALCNAVEDLVDNRSENSLKEIERYSDVMRETAKGWNDILTVQMQTVAKNYADGRVSLICDLRYLPIADVSVSGWVDDAPFLDREMLASVIFTPDVLNVRKLFFDEEGDVLIPDIQLVQMPDGFTIPSRVRLNYIHKEVSDLFGGFLFKSVVDGRYKCLPGIAHEEASVVVPYTRKIKLDFADGVIEGAPKVVNRVANDSENFVINRLLHSEVKEAVSRMRVVLDGDRVRVTIPDLVNLRCEVVDVLMGSLDL